MDSEGLPVGIQQRLMRHASVTTTMNHYGAAMKADLRAAQERVFGDMNPDSQFHSSFNPAN